MRQFLLLFLAALTISVCGAQTNPSPREREVKSYSLPLDKVQQAIAFARARHELYFVEAAWQMLTLIALLGWRIGPRFRDWAERISPRRLVQAYVFAPLLLLFIDGLDLPVSAYGQQIQLHYEQSVQGWGSWFWDWAKGELINFALAGLLVWILYGMIRRSPRRWWFYSWLVAVPIVILLMFLRPLVADPLFYRFEPLAAKQPQLVAEISKVVARGGLGIPASRMFEMNASGKLTTPNAYVTGLGTSKRVVVWDTTIAKMTPGETLFVFGHEVGHYVLNHVLMQVGLICGMLLVSLFLGFHSARWALERWKGRWAVHGMGDWASLPVLLLTAGVLGFCSEPLTNSFSRVLEHNADVYGLEVIHGIVPDSSQAAAHAFQILGEESLADPNPGPFIQFWFYDHPALAERVRFAAAYDPWGAGKMPKYVK